MTAPAKAAPVTDAVNRHAVALRDGRLTPEQVDLLKRTVAKGATDDEFALFLHIANKTGLDPFARQIYCLKRRTFEDGQWTDAMVPQTGIDGFRLTAERSGSYEGQTKPVFYDAAGNERAIWLDPKKPPYACTVGVLKRGFREPLYATALYHEYVQNKKDGTPNKMWKEKPSIMLAKCAEALALRKAFPQELSGLYSEDEIPADVEELPTPKPVKGTLARVPDQAGLAEATEDGDVVLHFGRFRGTKLSQLPTSALIETFRDPWRQDPARRQAAVERIGAGFVSMVEATLRDRQVPDDMTVRVAKLIERRASGEVLVDTDADDLRLWYEDHAPSAPHA